MRDVGVVGAGPAGCMAAWKLSQAGLGVVVLERRSRIGEPVLSGEVASATALRDNGLGSDGDFVLRKVRGVSVHSPDGSEYSLSLEGFHLDRAAFDRYLAELAVSEGTMMRLGTYVYGATRSGDHWRLDTSRGDIRVRTLVAADGQGSRMGAALGLGVSPRRARSLVYRFPPSKAHRYDSVRTYVGEGYRGGFAWCFDRGRELSVGVVTTGRPRPLLESLCKRLGLPPGERVSTVGGLIPQGGPNPSMAGSWVVTVGAAAGLTNPVTAGGTHAALHSARMATEAILPALEADRTSHLRAYEDAMLKTPFCDPMLMEARALLDRLTDHHWNTVVGTLEGRDITGLSTLRLLPRLLRMPTVLPRLWSLRSLHPHLRDRATYGW